MSLFVFGGNGAFLLFSYFVFRHVLTGTPVSGLGMASDGLRKSFFLTSLSRHPITMVY
jgi:hypothetical protein